MPKDKDGKEISQEQFDALSKEDKAAAVKVAGPAPEIKAADIVGLKELMSETLTEFVANAEPAPTATDDGHPKPATQAGEADPLLNALDQVTAPKIDKATLIAEGAQDAAVFYATHPEAVKHTDALEASFKDMMDQGRPFTRAALFEWFKGKNFEKFHEEKVNADKKTAEEAEHSTTVDSGGRPVLESPKVDEDSSDDDLNKVVENAQF